MQIVRQLWLIFGIIKTDVEDKLHAIFHSPGKTPGAFQSRIQWLAWLMQALGTCMMDVLDSDRFNPGV